MPRSFGLRRRIRSAWRRAMAPIDGRLGVIVGVATNQPYVALTFDDGPDPASTPRLLDILARHRAKATFFVVGAMGARYPELLRRVALEGHEIGNHSWNHPSFPFIGAPERMRQVARCNSVVGSYNTNRLFRPPFGDLDWSSHAQLLASGYRVVGWSASGTDWAPRDVQTIVDTVERALAPGSIVLLHDNLFAYSLSDEPSREATLEAVTRLLERSSFRFVTVSELLTLGPPLRHPPSRRSDAAWLRNLVSADGLGFRY